jgi:hypothetical protein
VLVIGPRSLLLLQAASEGLAGVEAPQATGTGALADLAELLRERNGFYAFESGLHVFASGDGGARGGSLEEWNAPDGWRTAFGGMADGFLFFAEGVLGGQFAIRADEVFSFDPETGQHELLASSIEGWADRLLVDYALLSGFPLARRWQRAHGPLAPGMRLVPRIPFVLGGEFDVSNVYALDAAEGMRVRGELAVQIRDLADGAKVQYRIVD